MAKTPEGMEENMEVPHPTHEDAKALLHSEKKVDPQELREYLEDAEEEEISEDTLGSLYKEEGTRDWKKNDSEAA